jgi:hypothetical protein
MSPATTTRRHGSTEPPLVRTPAALVVSVVCVLSVLGAIVWAGPLRPERHRSVPPPQPSTRPTALLAAPPPRVGPPTTPYEATIDAARSAGLHVWLEADLVKRWLEGRAFFDAGIETLAGLLQRPGVLGVKIADQLGYQDGLDSQAKVQAFLDAAATGLAKQAPRAKIAVDMTVPALGCLPGTPNPPVWATVCTAEMNGQYPQLSPAAVQSYLESGDIDVLDLAPGLLPAQSYVGWATTVSAASEAAWDEIDRLGWRNLVRLQARKALAHPGTDPSTAAQARAEVADFIETPVRHGVPAVDVWTWRQRYQGEMYRLMDPGMQPNALWRELVGLHDRKVAMFTHFSPSSVESSVVGDLGVLRQAFTDVFVAAGIG